MTDTDIEMTIRKYLLFKRRPPSKENDKDILYNKNLLINYCKNFYFFSRKIVSSKNYNIDNILQKILEHINFLFIRRDTKIWNLKDDADDIYLIFLGEVNIYKPPEKKDGKIIMQLDTVLGRGHLLGGECLKYNNINLDNKRTYLAKSKCNCILGKINTKTFFQIYKSILSEENNLLNNFLKDLEIFSSEFNGKFLKHSTLLYYKKDEYIFKQDDEYDTFYLIYKGNVRLYINSKKFVKSKIDYDLLKGKNTNERFTTSMQFEIKGSYNELINYNLIDAGRGDFIGGIEYWDNYANYRYNAKCITDVAILKIDLNLFNSIFINKEKKVFKAKIEKQKEFINKRIEEIKERKGKVKFDDYILSKNKYVKTFLLSNPLSKKAEEKLDSYINCNVNPIKIKYSNKNLKTINTSKNLVPKYMEEFNEKIKLKKKMKKRKLTIKDFVTNIDYKKHVKVANIFPLILSEEEEELPKKHKTIRLKSENKKVDKNINTEPINEKGRILNFRSFSNRNIKINFGGQKNNDDKIINNNLVLKKHLFLDLRSKNSENQFEIKRKIYKFKTTKYKNNINKINDNNKFT